MSDIERFSQRIDALNLDNFHELALDLFQFQYNHNKIYKKFVDGLRISPNNVRALNEIPFLPIEFFKSQKVVIDSVKELNPQAIFESSGTGSSFTSKHYVYDLIGYHHISKRIFECTYGSLDQYCILALLPSYLERDNSSLISMVNSFIKETRNPLSGFYLNDYKALLKTIDKVRSGFPNTKIILWGVSFALLDIAEQYKVNLSDCIIMETGGMKGRREEMVREELHEKLTQAFHVDCIHSEYGMTELLSQSYSKGEGIFYPGVSMKILLREPNDPLTIINSVNKAGGINVIDLANLHSCCFIETKDIGKLRADGSFEVLGRFDNSDIRGCNLLVQ